MTDTSYEQEKKRDIAWAKRLIFFLVCIVSAIFFDAAYHLGDSLGCILILLLAFIATGIIFSKVEVI
jgi:hypothetical protein